MLIRFLRNTRKLNQVSYSSVSEMEHRDIDCNSNHSSKQRYNEVIQLLNGLQSNPAVLSRINPSKSCQAPNIDVTNKYLKRCGINLDHLDGRVIHVSGTKGKGSTCALTESVLRSHNFTTGFYSSPHLFSVTERIRINGKPLSQDLFTKYFWEVYNMLDNNKEGPYDMPSYFKLLTVLAFKVFISEMVDVAIIEVGIGGEYDCTNTLRRTSVVGVTSLGYDHMNVLGNTVEEIAWNKAGIMKEGCLAFTCSDQPPAALQILQNRAEEKNCELFIIERNISAKCLPTSNKLLELNCSLAAHLAHAWMYLKTGISPFSPDPPRWQNGFDFNDQTMRGLLNCVWPGRFQIFQRGCITYYIDGAHTEESMVICSEWFFRTVRPSGKKVLVFNLTGSRDARIFLKLLTGCKFELTCFCPNILNTEPLIDNLSVKVCPSTLMDQSMKNATAWQEITGVEGKVFTSVSETFSFLESLNQELHVLVTGSLHLVGNVTCYLQPDVWDKILS